MAWKKPPSQVYYIGCLFYPSFLAPCSSREVLQKAIPSNTRYGNHRELFSWLPMGKYLLMGISARNAVSTLTRRPAHISLCTCGVHAARTVLAKPKLRQTSNCMHPRPATQQRPNLTLTTSLCGASRSIALLRLPLTPSPARAQCSRDDA